MSTLLEKSLLWLVSTLPFAYALTGSVGHIALLFTIVVACLIIVHPATRPRHSDLAKLRPALVFSALILLFFTYHVANSAIRGDVSELWLALSPSLPLLCAIPIVAALSLGQNTVISAQSLANTAMAFMPLLVLVNIGEVLWGATNRLEGLSGNALLHAFPLALVPFLTLTNWRESPIWFRALGILSICFFMWLLAGPGQSRGPVLVMLALLLFSLVYWGQGLVRTRHGRWSILAVFCLLIGASWFILTSTTGGRKLLILLQNLSEFDYSQVELVEKSARLRIIMWVEGWQAFTHSLSTLIFGYGLPHRFDAIAVDADLVNFRMTHLHNWVLTAAVGGGVVAVLIATLIVAAPYGVLWFGKTTQPAQSAFVATIACFGCAGQGLTNVLFFNDLSISLMLSLTLLVFAMSKTTRQQPKP